MPYDTLAFLLDRANIEDVIHRIGAFLDEGRYDRVPTELLAHEVWIDYSAIFNKPAGFITAEAQTQEWKDLIEQLTACQHAFTTVISDLPQPGDIDPPQDVSVFTNYQVTLRRDSAPGETWSLQTGRFRYQVTRTDAKGNPWRVTSIKLTPVHQAGAPNIYEGKLGLKDIKAEVASQ